MSFRTPPRRGAAPPPPPSGPSASQNGSEIDLTIQAELNKIRDSKDKYPAADLLNALLRFNTINANTSPRDIHTSAQVVIRSNKVYESILQAMDTLDASSIEALVANWSLFDNYTTAIPILERILLDLAENISKERTHVPPDTSTQDAVMHIHAWLADRTALKKALEDLQQQSLQDVATETAKKELIADYVIHRRKDDDSTLKVLQNFISTKSTLTEQDIIQKSGQKLLSEVKTLLAEFPRRLQQKPPSEEVSGVVVRAVMTVYIPFAVIAAPKTDLSWQTYLQSEAIWTSLKNLLMKVTEHIDKPVVDLEKIFGEVEALLLKLTETTVETAKELLELIKLCARIHRPYSGRTVALTKAFYEVDQSSQQNKALVARRHDLRDAMQAAITYLVTIKESSYNLKDFSLESSDYKRRKDEHKKLFENTEKLYTTFNIPSGQWTTKTTAYNAAVGVDEKNVQDSQKKMFAN